MEWFQKNLGQLRSAFDPWNGLGEFCDLFSSRSPKNSAIYKRNEEDGTVTIYMRSASKEFAVYIGAVSCAEPDQTKLDWIFES